MAQLHNLVIEVETTGKRIPVEQVDDQVTAQELFDAFAGRINLPAGTKGILSRKATHRQILPKQTLHEAGVQDRDVLVADFEKTAGG